MSFIFKDEFIKCKNRAGKIHNVGLRFSVRSFVNQNLQWASHDQLTALKPSITTAVINKETDNDAKQCLKFLEHLHGRDPMKGWIYSGPKSNADVTPIFDEAKMQQIELAFVRAKNVLDKAIAVASEGAARAGTIFRDWFGNHGNENDPDTARARSAKTARQNVAEQLKLIRAGYTRMAPVASDDPEDRDGVASAYPPEDWNVTYVLDDFWYSGGAAKGTDAHFNDVVYGHDLMQVQSFIHEWSHKYCSPVTIDVNWSAVPGGNRGGYSGDCYGAEECRHLASVASDLAVTNADNYGYFAIAAWHATYRATPLGSAGGSKFRFKRVTWDKL